MQLRRECLAFESLDLVLTAGSPIHAWDHHYLYLLKYKCYMAERGIWGVGQVRWFHGVVDYYIRDDLVLLPTLVVVLGWNGERLSLLSTRLDSMYVIQSGINFLSWDFQWKNDREQHMTRIHSSFSVWDSKSPFPAPFFPSLSSVYYCVIPSGWIEMLFFFSFPFKFQFSYYWNLLNRTTDGDKTQF